ncbi:MAG: cation:proton antiporter [Gammaproteobacteria bacterium]|nr:cation:proton antiporter [Gammaproteobacteria bacterium]
MTVKSFSRMLYVGCLLALFPVSVWASTDGLPSLVRDIGLCIVFAGLLAIVFVRFNIPEIAAYLVAGVVVGPIGTAIVTDPGNIETISELGLILLLYLIGLEIDVRKLLASGRILVVSGLLQYPLCVAFGIAVTKLLMFAGVGEELLSGSYAPLYIGFVIAASSTLLVVKLFQETFQLDTEAGRIALGLLIFQDIWAIGVIAVQPNFSSPELVPILLSFLGIAVLVVLAMFIAKFNIPIGFNWVAKKPEVVFAAAISWCFLIVLLGVYLDVLTSQLFDFDLHMSVGAEMGALIAGATIASLPYSTEIIGKVSVVRDFFVTLFFVGLGMSIPMPDGINVLILAGLFAVIAVLARHVIFFPLLYFTGLDRRNSMVTSIRLGQISEFSLVICFIGMQLGHITGGLNSAVIFAFVITALLTPLMYNRADSIHDSLSGLLGKLGFREPLQTKAGEDESYSLALLGFHRTASSLLHEIGRNRPELLPKTLVVDFNVNIHAKISELGVSVKYGDLCSAETLHHLGVDKAKVVVCTIPDDVLKGTTNRKIVRDVRHVNPNAVIIANAIELPESRALYEAGADYVFLQRVETARAVENAVEKALVGEIAEYRSSVEALYGEWHRREEVM